jgi:hypothetical protein
MINPRHMATKKPGNANDEDLFDGMSSIGKPLDQPTIMSYFIQRIRLGEICREITDKFPLLETDFGNPDFEQIKEIDRRMCEFSQSLPPFLHLNYDMSGIADSDPSRSHGITIYRYVINSMLHTQRCRLHLPYLSRGQDLYSYSRDACLEAARMVIRTEAQLSSEDISFAMTRLRFSGSLLCVCMAIIALLMDLCRNKSLQPDEDQERRAEIQNALRILEEGKSQSSFADKLLDTFNSILQRSKVPLPSERRTTRSKNVNRLKSPVPVDSALITGRSDLLDTEAMVTEPVPTLSDDIWQAFDATADPTTLFDWNSLLSELDAPFLSV